MTCAPTSNPDLDAVAAAVNAAGLDLRGGFHPQPDDGVPPLPDGAATGTVVLVGNVGGGMWARFSDERGEADREPERPPA